MISTVIEHHKNILRRFVSFFVIGFLTLIGELLLTAFLLYALKIQFVLAIGLGFFISLTLSYFLFRKYTFYGTKRGLTSGYIYFSIIAVSGLFIVMGGSYLAVTHLGIHPLLARFLLGGVSGVVNFLINIVYNFKVAHVH